MESRIDFANLMGTRLLKQTINTSGSLLQVDVSKLQTGMYILEVVEDDKIIVQEKVSIVK